LNLLDPGPSDTTGRAGGRRRRGILGVLSTQPHIEDLVASERLRLLRRVEYDWMVGQGFFETEKVELLDGVIVEMSPQGTRHAATVQRLNPLFVLALRGRAAVRVQSPFVASDISEPEPDIAIVPPGDYDASHPSQAFLLVEVAESSINRDRRVKTRVYAAAGVPEYWLVDVASGTIEIRTQPTAGGYSQVRIARSGESIRLQAFPDVEIAVSDVVR
jgi:Uma2 family endonuclease